MSGGLRPARAALDVIARPWPSVRPPAQRAFWKAVYGLSARRAGAAGSAFMNYGYAPLDGVGEAETGGADEFGTALYDRVAGATDLTGKDVLEVGCGRGGGTAHVFATHRPRSMVGVDLSAASIRRCRTHARPGLSFQVADAERLPFPDASFDVVLNVESCHCYPDVPRFLEEVARVLAPGGLLLLADMRHTDLARVNAKGPISHEEVADLRRQLHGSPLRILDEEDITPNVRRALELDTPRRLRAVEEHVPRPLRGQALNFAGVEGSALHGAFVNGDVTYLRFALGKEPAPEVSAGGPTT